MNRPETASGELTEIGRLFHAKLQHLKKQETRSSAQSYRRTIAARRRSKLETVDSQPSDDPLLSTAESPLCAPYRRFLVRDGDLNGQSVRVSDSMEVIAETHCGVKAMTSESPPRRSSDLAARG